MESNQAFHQRTTAMICHCRKICKNTRDLNVHQVCMKCQVESIQRQCTGTSPGETQEEQGREAHHRAKSLQAEAQNSPKTSKTVGSKIKWPTAVDKRAWNDFDSDICEIPKVSAKGAGDKRLLTTFKITVSYAAERYEYEERKE